MPARFNLVCHGMILFVENANDTMSIVIPITPTHRQLAGDLSRCGYSKRCLTPLVQGAYALGGVSSSARPFTELFSPSQYLLLRQSAVAYNALLAEASSTVITVPKPSIIRFYRPSEPNVNIFGWTPVSVAHAVPKILHDVVVLSYRNVPTGTALSLSGPNGVVLDHRIADGEKTSWSLYSADESAPATPGDRHPTYLNQFLSEQSNGRLLDLTLSGIGPKDGAPETDIGLAPEHTLDFQDLKAEPGDAPTLTSCGRLGCTGVAYARY